jgi:putative FmdB family regulatory protein
MPNYDYHCKSCDHTWERQLPIADRDTPLHEPCPHCALDELVIERLVAAPGVSYSVIGLRHRTPDSFKDVLRNIKSKHAHANIDV